PSGEREGVAETRVAPADVLGVLLVRVLAVVDQQVGLAGEVEARDPLPFQRLELSAETGLMIGDVGQRGAVLIGDPVAERRPAVGDGLGPDPGRPDLPFARRGVEEAEATGELSDLDGWEGGRDIAGDAFLE